MSPEAEAAVESLRQILPDQKNFRSNMTFDATEKIENPQGPTYSITIRASTRFGFSVRYKSSEAELLAGTLPVAVQLNSLAYEEVARRYIAMRPKIENLAQEIAP